MKERAYQPSGRVVAQIERDFNYPPPRGEEQSRRCAALREGARQLAYTIANLTPEGREQSIALTKLSEVSMWANAAIAGGES